MYFPKAPVSTHEPAGHSFISSRNNSTNLLNIGKADSPGIARWKSGLDPLSVRAYKVNWETARIDNGMGESFTEYFQRESSVSENNFNLQTFLALNVQN